MSKIRSAANGRRLLSGHKLEVFESGRLCVAPTCTTRLSQYNPTPSCFQHLGWVRDGGPRTRRQSSH